MTGHSHAASFVLPGAPAAQPHGMAAGLISRLLPKLDHGRIVIDLPSGEQLDLCGSAPGIEARLTINTWRALRRLLLGGDVGFAKSYVDGDWSTPDLLALLELVAAHGTRLTDQVDGTVLSRVRNWVVHFRRANSLSGSRRNIQFHYDLGNAFYGEWLDPSMLYSSAIFASPDQTLEAAQTAKLRRIVSLLAIEPGQSVLEVGCGWGALAAAMARDAGAQVTGITLSPSQLDYGQALIAREGLGDHVELRLQDYRETSGCYDRLVSIEMIEAVGIAYWPGYFDMIRERLKPGGRAVLQAITIAADRFETYSRQPDFIQRYIFPGGCLPTSDAIRSGLAAAGLRLVEQHTFAESYARTLAEWRRRFLKAWPQIAALGFDMEFQRLWEYYLCYCEAGFRHGLTDVGLYVVEHEDVG